MYNSTQAFWCQRHTQCGIKEKHSYQKFLFYIDADFYFITSNQIIIF